MSYFSKRVAALATATALSAQGAFATVINSEDLADQYLPLGQTIIAGTDVNGAFTQPDGINGTFSYGAILGNDGSTTWERTIEAFFPSQRDIYSVLTTERSLLTNAWDNTRIVTPGHYVETVVENASAVQEFRNNHFGTEILADGTVQLTMNTGIIAEGTAKTFEAVQGAEDFFVAQDIGGAAYGLFAQGLEPDSYTYVQEAEGGSYPVGTEIDPANLNFSENARVSVKIELGEDGSPHFTSAFAGIGFDMEPAGINITLQSDGSVIDATQYHVTDVPDHIHIKISGREDLDAIQTSLVNGDGFRIGASSTLGRRAETHTIAGEGDFARDIDLTASTLREGTDFRFEPVHLVQRVLQYSTTATPLDSSVADSCETLGLSNLGLTANDVVLLPARVIAGTGVLPRESEAIVAVNPNDLTQVLAAAERYFVGQSMGEDGEFHSTISRSAANDHDAIQYGGCTGDITQTGAPAVSETTRTWVPPVVDRTRGTNSVFQDVTTGFFGSTTTTGRTTYTDTGTTNPPYVAPVPIEGAERYVVDGAKLIDDFTNGATNFEAPVRNFLERYWTPLESGSILLGSAIEGLSIVGAGAAGNRRRETSAPKPSGI